MSLVVTRGVRGVQWMARMKGLTNKPWGVNLTILPTMGKPPPYVWASVVCGTARVTPVRCVTSTPFPRAPLSQL